MKDIICLYRVLQLTNSQVGKLAQQSFGEAIQVGSSKPTQSKPIDDRTEKLVTQEIVGKSQESSVLPIDRGNL